MIEGYFGPPNAYPLLPLITIKMIIHEDLFLVLLFPLSVTQAPPENAGHFGCHNPKRPGLTGVWPLPQRRPLRVLLSSAYVLQSLYDMNQSRIYRGHVRTVQSGYCAMRLGRMFPP